MGGEEFLASLAQILASKSRTVEEIKIYKTENLIFSLYKHLSLIMSLWPTLGSGKGIEKNVTKKKKRNLLRIWISVYIQKAILVAELMHASKAHIY